MTKVHCQSAAAPVAPRSAARVINIDAVTNGTTFGGQGPVQGAQSPADLERITHWLYAVASPKVSAGRLKRITEGMRQTTALTSTRDGLPDNGKGEGQEGHAPCPVTGGYCGEKGYGPYGIHTACAPLDISAYRE